MSKRISITRSLTSAGLQETTKSGKKRVVPMNEDVFRTLGPLWKAQRGDFIFGEENGGPVYVAHLDRHFKKAQDRAGFTKHIRFHDLRHTYASHFMMNGGNIYDLQKILGHHSLEMTQRYAHLSPEHLEEAAKVVSFTAVEDLNNPEIIPSIARN